MIVRGLFATLLALVVGSPLACLALNSSDGWSAWREWDRVVPLFANTLALASLSALLAVPVGSACAFALVRLPLAGRRIFATVFLAGMFVPLPVYAVAWQILLGRWLPALALDPGRVTWRPWQRGLVPAAVMHAAAAVPWVVWIVGNALSRTSTPLEEAAVLAGGRRELFRRVLLPKALGGIAAAAAFVAVQASVEIPITDAMMVRTAAEEVYTQLVGVPNGVAAAVAVSVPSTACVMLAAVVLARRYGFVLLPAEDTDTATVLHTPRGVHSTATAFVAFVAFVVAVLPLVTLFVQASAGGLGTQLARAVHVHGEPLAGSLIAAVAAGLLTASLAWLACAGLFPSRMLFVACVALAVVPGPLIGFGLKAAISAAMDAEELVLGGRGPVREWLYEQPSAIPGIWSAVVRFFPFAVFVCWPAVRAVPRELLDEARLEGRSSIARVVWPLSKFAAARAAVVVSALALGEVSASKLVAPPGHRAYVLELFAQMHYGAEATVAALCLVQVAATLVVLAGFGLANPTRPGRV